MVDKREIKIVNFEERHLEDFKRISYQWLNKFDLLEPVDIEMLDNPKENIIDKGGYIFMAEVDGVTAGTLSLGYCDDKVYELLKMGVDEKYQGMGIAALLLKETMKKAKEVNADKVILYTNHLLSPALHLYEKFGFKVLELDKNKYDEADIKMECLLNKVN